MRLRSKFGNAANSVLRWAWRQKLRSMMVPSLDRSRIAPVATNVERHCPT
jgi:hypothetical protein